MTLIVEFELYMCRTHGGSFPPPWDPTTELRLSVSAHSASTPAPQDGVSMHLHFVLCVYPCFPCYFLLSVLPVLLDRFLPINSSPIFLLIMFFKLESSLRENAAFVFPSPPIRLQMIGCCTPYGWVRFHCTHLHSFSLLTHRLAVDYCEQWLYKQVCVRPPTVW